MNFQSEKLVRFNDWNAEKCPDGQYPLDYGLHSGRLRTTINSVPAKFQGGFESGSERFKRIKRTLKYCSFNSFVNKGLGSGKKVLDPQGAFLQKWNKIFVLSCVIAVSLDPLFFYVPVINGDRKCVDLDKKMETTASVLRSFTDIFYIFHIILQFRTGFIAPSSRVFGRGVLVEDTWLIAKKYMSSHFLVDILAVLPLPQVVILIIIPNMGGSEVVNTKNLLKFVVLFQYVPRFLRIYPLYKEVTRTSGILTETAWAGAAFNLFLYMLASHPADTKLFNFGIFLGALESGIVESTYFPKKFFYCFWWGLRNLSSLGQNLETSTYVWEICFAVFISISGLVLFSFLIGNMQTYLQSTTTRLEEMRVKRRDAEQWMAHRLLPDTLRERIRRYEQYKWQETRGVDEENLLCNLPKDLRRDIKRHLCLALLMRVPLFEKMDEQLLDALCDRLKPVLYTEESYIVREGDPVDEMLFIMRGKLLTITTNGGRTGFFNSEYLGAGDFCGEELLTWALDPQSSSNLPISTRTVRALTEVEAFALMADDLKFVASQFRRLHSKQLRHTFRFYSQQWRSWAACFIQAAWRRYSKKKLEESLRAEENRLQDALAKAGGSSPSLGATIYASRFAANALRLIRRNSTRKTRVPERVPPMLLQKPAEPDFTVEEQ
ncbi:Cyclic nucleotide-gated ion channel 1 [Citrus sinensis]|uniref:Cyclic nucleotide-gated ion channel 1 n=1 Tax=Citrus sinensis TaxID=2711 RepID=A0ACB8HRE6_CITSI|nr:Cyclic nucleotide-gated ion channel 1 [Citrus sinensis]KAH9677295.1 cyclic nucleotide-gated ion channel 1 [Citrus sinensis]